MKLGIREIVFLNVMLALLGASWWFGFKKVDDRKEEIGLEVEQRQRELSELREATADVEDLGRRIDDLQRAIEFFEGKLPRDKELAEVLKEVDRAAKQNRLDIRRFETLRMETGSHYREQPLRMHLSGDFNGFYSYLLEIEGLKRITRVTRMNLKKIGDRNGAMEAELTLSIFFEPTGMSVADVR